MALVLLFTVSPVVVKMQRLKQHKRRISFDNSSIRFC